MVCELQAKRREFPQRRCNMPGILACTALLLLSASSSYPQWERVVLAWTGVDDPLRPMTHGSPHPLQYYRRPSPERDPINSLNLGERVGTHQISLQDYVVQTSQRPLGESFGRKIIEIVLTLRHGSEMQTMEAEGSEQGDSCKDVPSPSVEEPRDVQWRSVVMESSPRAYLELYLLSPAQASSTQELPMTNWIKGDCLACDVGQRRFRDWLAHRRGAPARAADRGELPVKS